MLVDDGCNAINDSHGPSGDQVPLGARYHIADSQRSHLILILDGHVSFHSRLTFLPLSQAVSVNGNTARLNW